MEGRRAASAVGPTLVMSNYRWSSAEDSRKETFMRPRIRPNWLAAMISILVFGVLGLTESAEPRGRVLWQYETGG
jgi:hypothetical protein